MMSARGNGSLIPPADWARPVDDDQAGLTPGFLAMATVLGAVLRLYSLTGQSLWVDEMLTWQMIRPGIPAGFVEQILDSIQGPLYLAVTWPLIRLQDSALMLRLPAVVAGIVTIPLFGLIVSRLLRGRAARLALLLLAVNPFHVWYSQEGRGYSFLMMFSVLMALALLALGRRKSKAWPAFLFMMATAGAVWSNLGGMFLWLGMGLGVLLYRFPRNGREWGWWALAFGGGLLLVSPWLLKASGIWAIGRALPGSETGEGLRGDTTFSFLAWPYTLQTFFYGYSLGPSLRELHQPDRMAVLRSALPILFLGALPITMGLVAGLFRLDRKRGLLLIWIIVPMLILTFLALRNIKPWNPRYLAMVFPWVLALAASGLAGLPRRAGLAGTVLVIGLTLWSLGGYYWNERYFKADVRAAAAYLDDAAGQGDPILAPVITSVFKYYYRGPGEVIDSYGLPVLGNAAEAGAYLDRVLTGRTRCSLVLAREWYFDPGGHLPRELARRGHLRLLDTQAGVRVFGWDQQTKSGIGP